MADDGVRMIRGRAVPQPATHVKRGPDDVRPCASPGCANEGMYIPCLTVWSKDDKDRKGRFVVFLIQLTLCRVHASTKPADYKPDAKMLAHLTGQLGGEPDLENMVVQFYGNTHCRADYALDEALKACGTFDPPKAAGATRVAPQ